MVELKIFKTTQTSKYLRHSSPCKKNAGISFLQDRVFTPGDPLPVLHPKPGMCQATGLADFWLFMQILMVAQLVKNLPAMQETGFNSWVRKIPWSRKCIFTPIFLPGELHRQRNLVCYSPQGCKESDTTERLTPDYLPSISYSQPSLSLNHGHGSLRFLQWLSAPSPIYSSLIS